MFKVHCKTAQNAGYSQTAIKYRRVRYHRLSACAHDAMASDLATGALLRLLTKHRRGA
jgi:hypothetical protein